MRFLANNALIFVCSVMCINCFFVDAAAADSATYVYRGNNFEQLEGDPEVFSLKDRVVGRFTVDCSIAHPEGTCANLPWDNYFWLGAVSFESIHLMAGPATLPTDDGYADVNRFRFSTDADGQIVHWDIDLSFMDPSGLINVDTDKKPWGSAIDSAAALGGGASVYGNPGRWKKVGTPGGPHESLFNNRTYGNSVDGGSCTYLANGHRCRAIHVRENYDVKGTFEDIEASFETWRDVFDPSDGSWENTWRVLTCPVDQKSISAHTNHVTIEVVLDTEDPECYQWGYREGWDPDPSIGYYWEPYFYSPGVRIIEGEWRDPFSYGSSMWIGNYKSSSYDGWSGTETTEHGVNHCDSRWGDMMTSGGFTTTSPSGAVRSYEFVGPDAPTWSSYNVSSCNDKYMQK